MHYLSGVIITIFIAMHLFNHACSVFGAEVHIEIMNYLRLFYRNIIIETVLLIAVLVQIISGIKLFKTTRKTAVSHFEKMHVWSGLYLAFFLFFHTSVVLMGRNLMELDTNFYFGVAGLNTFPFYLFFVPYYGLAIISFFSHIGAIHSKKMNQSIFGFSPLQQAKGIVIFGVLFTIFIGFALTNHFKGVYIPAEYNVMVGK